MTREVSRRLSYDPVLKGALRPDVVGQKRLDPEIVEDRPDPAKRGADMDEYLRSLDLTEGLDKPRQLAERRHRPRVLKPRVPNGER